MHQKVLLVEDSKEILRIVQQAIEGPVLTLDWAGDLLEAKEYLKKNQYDLVLLDVELPDGNSFNLCSEIQTNQPKLPIFFLTAHDNLSEKVMAFSVGADDYITKPFDSLELKARVEGKLKKQEILKQSSDSLKWNSIEIDKISQEVLVKEGDEMVSVELTALEFKLLTYFAMRVEEVVDRDTILNDIWGKDVHVYSRSVDTHVSKLRKKLGPSAGVIESVHGTGYKFSPEALS